MLANSRSGMRGALRVRSTPSAVVRSSRSSRSSPRVAAAATTPSGADSKTGIKMMRKGVKEAADENILTPRFYTTVRMGATTQHNTYTYTYTHTYLLT